MMSEVNTMVKDNLALFFRVIDELIEPVCEHYGVSPLVALTKILGAIQEEHINDKTMLALLDAPKKSLEAVSFSRLKLLLNCRNNPLQLMFQFRQKRSCSVQISSAGCLFHLCCRYHDKPSANRPGFTL